MKGMNRTLDDNKESDKAEYPARQETDGGTSIHI